MTQPFTPMSAGALAQVLAALILGEPADATP